MLADRAGQTDPLSLTAAKDAGGNGAGYPYQGTYLTQAIPDGVAVDANSQAMIANLNSQLDASVSKIRWMVNDDSNGHHGYNFKVYKATDATPTVHLNYACDDPGAHPKPADWDKWATMPVDPSWKAPDGTDGAVTVVGPDATWSLWQFKPNGGNPSACYGGKMAITNNAAENEGTTPGVYQNRGGADATSMAGDGGAISPSDVQSGAIRHALYATIPSPKADSWRWPATRTDGDNTDPNAIPEGALVKLNLTQEQINALPTKFQREVATAATTYGLRIADKTGMGNPATLSTVSDPTFWGKYLPGQNGGDISAIPWDSLQVVDLNAASTMAPPGTPLTGSFSGSGGIQALPASGDSGNEDTGGTSTGQS